MNGGSYSGDYGSHLSIDNLDYGVSLYGISKYQEELKTFMFDNAIKVINDRKEDVKKALDECWVGVSRNKFDKLLDEKCEALREGLLAEYQDLEKRINDIAHNMINQDKFMGEEMN